MFLFEKIQKFWNNYINDLDNITHPQGETKMARIEITPEGRALLLNGSSQIATYARKRDAVRGAARRGLVIA